MGWPILPHPHTCTRDEQQQCGEYWYWFCRCGARLGRA